MAVLIREPVAEQESNLAYTERLIAFVDVQGFGSLVETSAKTPAAAKKAIGRISEAVLYSLNDLEKYKGPYGGLADIAFTQFSDSFVISCVVDPKMKVPYRFTFALLAVIDEFLRSELLLRGGVTQGKLIHTDKLLFGPAMNRAYELESKFAKVPRIIIDPELNDVTKIEMLDYSLARDDDGFLFLDYFSPQKRFFVEPGWKLAVQEVIEAVPRTPELLSKRKWLISKYNKSLRGWTYEKFRQEFRQYCDDGDANGAVVEDSRKILSAARRLRRLRV